MSTVFTLRCDLHEVYGPDLARSAGGVGLLGTFTPGEGGARGGWSADAQGEWAAFLIEHEWCDLRLVHEYAVDHEAAKAPPPITEYRRLRAAVAEYVTAETGVDGLNEHDPLVQRVRAALAATDETCPRCGGPAVRDESTRERRRCLSPIHAVTP